jgi:signal transduction histidine kinase
MSWTRSWELDVRTLVVPASRRRAPADGVTVAGFALLAIAFAIVERLWRGHLADDEARSALDMLLAICAVVAAVLLGSQFRRTRTWRDLLLLTALVTVCSTDVASSALPGLSDSAAIGPVYGVRLVAEVMVAVAFALAAFAPSRKRVRGWVPVVLIGVTCLTALVVALALDFAAKRGITQADLTSSRASDASHTTLWLWVTIASAATQLVAGAAFAWRIGANQRGSLLAGACFLLTAVRLQYVAVPVVASDWITPADALRVVAYGLLLAFALHEHARARRAREHAMLDAERTRIARDLHDGIAQDLAVIATQARRLIPQLGDEHPVAIAARRALAVGRGAILDLSASHAPGVEAALQQVARELESLYHVEVVVWTEAEQDDELEQLDAKDREHLVRIAREAIVNAVKHGGARHVEVVLHSRGAELVMRVSDDGRGILRRPPAEDPGGFGLPAMRSRAAALGGHLIARRRHAGGTDVEVTTVIRHRR